MWEDDRDISTVRERIRLVERPKVEKEEISRLDAILKSLYEIEWGAKNLKEYGSFLLGEVEKRRLEEYGVKRKTIEDAINRLEEIEKKSKFYSKFFSEIREAIELGGIEILQRVPGLTSTYGKRRREVEKFIPDTKKSLQNLGEYLKSVCQICFYFIV